MSLTRREFLVRAAGGGAAAATGAVLPGCAPDVDPAPVVDVPDPAGGRLSLFVPRYPDLDRPGGAVIARAPALATPVLVARTPEGGFVAMSSVCPHRGCPVGVQQFEVVCPCHASRFDLQGRVTRPPALQGLTAYVTFYDPLTGELAVDLLAGDPGFPAWNAGVVSFPFAQFPLLQLAGGSVAGRPGGAPRPVGVLVVAQGGGAYSAVDAICTHLGCTVGYDGSRGLIVCPCHDSRYATDGTVVQGPATRNLERFEISADALGVTVRVPA
jgi:Rieske Fe-S protein